MVMYLYVYAESFLCYLDWLAIVTCFFRDNTRMITSLPVSPCSSPLRQYGPAHKSCFLSPPHPTYTLMGQNTLPSYPVRSNATFTLDPFHETAFYKAHTPGGSPRRLIWVADCIYLKNLLVSLACLVVCGWTSICTLTSTNSI